MLAEKEIDALPIEIGEITADLIRSGLAERFVQSNIAANIRDIRIEEVHHGFSTILRIHLEADEQTFAAGLPRSVILKGGFEDFSRERGRDFTYHSLEWEYHAYHLLPELGLHMPETYCLRLDPVREQMVILMEDLTLRDVRFQRGLEPNSAAQVARRLTALADFHARTWDCKDLEPGGKYGGLRRNGARMFLQYLEHGGFTDEEFAKFVEMPRIQACPVAMHDYDWLKRIMAYTGDLSEAIPNCVIHGDTHLGNLYEEADGTPGFFDSLARQEPGISEATYHICNALDPKVRRESERDLIAHYRSELKQRGIAVPNLHEMMHQYTAFLSLNLITFFVNPNHYQTEAFNTAHAVRAAMAMLDNNAFDLLDEAADGGSMPDKVKYGPWAVVAGSSEGIGLAFVREIAGAGINVVMVARRPDALTASAEQVAAEFGVEVRTVQAELASSDIVEKLSEATDDIDVGLLVFNAAAANFKPFLDQNETEFLAAINLSCIAQTRLVQHFGRKMRARGRGGLLLVSSFAGSAGIPQMACYSGAKGFTDKFGEALWAELKPQGIDVFVMVVGSTNTERRRQSGSKDVPGMPVAEPEDVAAYALASLGGDAPIGALPIYDGVWQRVYDTDRVAAVTGHQTQIPVSDKIF